MINKAKTTQASVLRQPVKPIDECLPIFDDIVEKVLAEEEKTYQCDLLPFEQHADLVKEQVHQSEKAYLERMEKAVKLLEKRFGKKEKYLMFLKI